jgi:hypothetical protein
VFDSSGGSSTNRHRSAAPTPEPAKLRAGFDGVERAQPQTVLTTRRRVKTAPQQERIPTVVAVARHTRNQAPAGKTAAAALSYTLQLSSRSDERVTAHVPDRQPCRTVIVEGAARAPMRERRGDPKERSVCRADIPSASCKPGRLLGGGLTPF